VRTKVSFIRRVKRNGQIYLAEVETQRHAGKVQQKFIRYIGKEADQKKDAFPQQTVDSKAGAIKIYGSVICLDYIARQLGLYERLGEHAPAILTLVFCHCHDYRSISDVSKWFKKTDLDKIFSIPEITEKQLRDSLIALEELDLFEFQKSIFEKTAAFCEEKISSAIYDVTNIYFAGTRCSLAKYGKDKENVKGRPLVQIGLGITKKAGIPIFHQVHPGNVHDAKIFQEAIVLLRRYGIKKGTIVHDRGITSKSSVLRLANLNWKIIAGVSLHRGIKNIISNLDFSGIENFRNIVIQGDTIFHVVSFPHTMGHVQGKLLILLNRQKRLAKSNKRLQTLIAAKEKLSEGKEIDSKLKKFFTKSKQINTHAVKRAEKYDGISAIFTTGKFSKEEVVHSYFGKDVIEKSFQTLKSVLALRPVRVWLKDRVQGHILICYLSYLLLTTFRYLLQKNLVKSKFSNVSTLVALEEISNVYRIYFNSNENSQDCSLHEESPITQSSQLVTMTELQTEIMKAISSDLVL
jgi:transposase